MFNNELKRIKDEVRQQLGDDDDAALAKLWGRVLKSFEQWKQEQGDRKTRANRGMLSNLAGGKPIPFKKATPWQCADFMWPSPVALAVKLQRENYRPFREIMKQDGTRKVLAMLIVRFGKDSNESDVRAAHRMLSADQLLEAGISEGINITSLRHKMNFDKVRPKGVLARQKIAEKKQALLNSAIKDLFDKPEKPGWRMTNEKIADFLVPCIHYKRSVILVAVKREAAKYRKAEKQKQASQFPKR